MKALDYFTAQDKERIGHSVKDAEKNTSGEIRVYLEDHCKGDVMDRAAFVFAELQMHKTEQRNGVLIYLALKEKKFAVIGDAGINTIVGPDFWNSVKELMLGHFKHGRFTDGLMAGIAEAGKILQTHFPFEKGDTNELSDEVVIR